VGIAVFSQETTDPFEAAAALRRIAAIQSGSIVEWHRFIHTTSPLVLHVIRRYLPSAPVDDQRSLYVTVLESLYRGDLRAYDGRARLTTWLFIYTRSRCLDYLRHQKGRRSVPAWLRRLPALDRDVYRLYYGERLSTVDVCQRLGRAGKPLPMAELVAALDRIEQHVDDRLRRRMAFELQALSIGSTSGRLLEYLHRTKIEMEMAAEDLRPDARLIARDTHRMLGLVRKFIDLLPEVERRVIGMRFYERRTAEETAKKLQLEGQRKVYTIEDRALRRLKGMFPP
jgi:DNA-directed RNA polymerase specialized sigma24 family protein